MNDNLKNKLAQLPTQPGVYIMYDLNGNILYVGKAKNLKNRVRQYFFIAGNKTEKVMLMVSHINDFKYIITASETDAFALENTLIKKHKPPYNIMLKDDKQYPYIKIKTKENFPRLEIVRRIVKDNAKYFGPIMGSSKDLVALIRDVFPSVSCKNNLERLPKNFRPCLNFHIGKCPAPCIGKISSLDYHLVIKQIIEFLNGDDVKVYNTLKENMMKSSEKEEYEKALLIKQQLHVLDKLRETKVVTLSKLIDMEIFSIVSNGKNAVVNNLIVRNGRVIVSENYNVFDAGIDDGQTLNSFLNMYYDSNTLTSGEIIINVAIEDFDAFEAFLSNKYSKKVTIAVPKKGVKKQLSDMSANNALDYLTKNQNKLDNETNMTVGAMEQLKTALNLLKLPQRIECFDISNISGVDSVASMVVIENGVKAEGSYRRFKINTVEGADDFKSMYEVVSRRLQRLKQNDAEFGATPDLILIDGGLGQLHSAQKAMDEVGIQIPLVSIAEREEQLYTLESNAPVAISRQSFALKMLINLRDEAHRFAITYFRNLHSKNAFKSQLSEIDGVGAVRQKALLKSFSNIENIKKAEVDEISKVAGINKTTAENIYKFFHTIDKT